VPIQLAQCWFPGLAISNAKIKNIFKKYTEAILSNSTRKLFWFEISKMLIVLFIIIFGTLSFAIIKHVVRAFERRENQIKSNMSFKLLSSEIPLMLAIRNHRLYS